MAYFQHFHLPEGDHLCPEGDHLEERWIHLQDDVILPYAVVWTPLIVVVIHHHLGEGQHLHLEVAHLHLHQGGIIDHFPCFL